VPASIESKDSSTGVAGAGGCRRGSDAAGRRPDDQGRQTVVTESALAARAVVGGALLLADHADRRTAITARLAVAAVDQALVLEVPALAIAAEKVAQRRSPVGDRLREGGADRLGQPVAALQAQAPGRHRRPDAGPEQALAGVNIADPDHSGTSEQELLDRHFPAAGRGVQGGAIERRRQWLDAELGKERVIGNRTFIGRVPEYRPEAPRVAIAQRALFKDQVDMVMTTRRRCSRLEAQGSGHAQVHQQRPRLIAPSRLAREIEQQILAAAAHADQPRAGQAKLEIAVQREAQARCAHNNVKQALSDDPGLEATTDDFDFGQLWQRGFLEAGFDNT